MNPETEPKFIAEIVIRKVGDKYEAQWSGDEEKFFEAPSPVEALMKVAVAVDAGLR